MSLACSGMALGLLVGALAFAAAAEPPAEGELVQNPDFRQAGSGNLPAQWTAWTPLVREAACAVRATPKGLRVDAPGKPYAVGGVTQDLRGVEGGRAYAVEAACDVRKLPSPFRSLWLRINWTRRGKLLHPAGMLARGPRVEGDTATFRDVLVAPKETDGARLSLEVKWPRGGSALWTRVSVRPTAMPKPRKVKVGSVYLRPTRSTPAKNLDLWCQQIDDAGKLGLDVVCLGEAITIVGTRATATDRALPVPGPVTKRLGEAARRNRLWVVAGITERDSDAVYNTAVLMDRRGRLAGTYRKVHLPREEWKKGVMPGREYPVFRTDFGIVAIQICYDWFFPEAAQLFALQGAEILFAPTWGNTLPDKDGCVDGESTFRVRARDNGLYIVPSVYSGRSMVIDPMGRILVANKGRQRLVWCEIDLARRDRLSWVGRWRDIGPRDRMPATYPRLLAEPQDSPDAPPASP